MVSLSLETRIAAPIERCFLLSLSIDLHQDSAEDTNERAVAGVTTGIIGPNERVRWQGRHFGLMLSHESVISGYDRPCYFQDRMTRGLFRSFVHDHTFVAIPTGTLMRDELRFEAPLGVLGRLVERMALRRHLLLFLRQRNEVIRRVAEAPEEAWRRYLGSERI